MTNIMFGRGSSLQISNYTNVCVLSDRSGTICCPKMDVRWGVSEQSSTGWEDCPDHWSQHGDWQRNSS